MIKPPPLQPGDALGIISPSWGGAGAFPHRTALGIKQLHEFGFSVKVGTHALNQRGFVSDTPENRVADLHTMFADPEVKAIIAAIGGDHACHLLPLLDLDLIRDNPTILVGYSDITVLNVALWQAIGLVTFNGPMLLTDFAEQPEMYTYTAEYFLRVTGLSTPSEPIVPAGWWTEEFLDWELRQDLTRHRDLNPSEGWTWLKDGDTEGVLIGGCLESLDHLRGTRFWPDWTDAIFFFELSEESPSPARVDSLLMDYENMGVLEKLQGMLVGRPYHYSPEKKEDLRQVILDRTAAYDFPIVTDMDFGHTAPQFTLPIGCRARLNSATQEFQILQAAVE